MKGRAGLQALVAFGSGALFGAGLLLSGMTRPQKVLGFLDVFGAWDASLAFVMVGAIGVHLLAYRFIRGRPAPVLARDWALPTRRDVDFKLVLGAVIFGIGWGLAGYCPGPAVVSLGSGALGVVVFVVTMLLGTLAASRLERALARNADPAALGVKTMNSS
jgi:uncharacterized membrane protein YedE/YeeE